MSISHITLVLKYPEATVYEPHRRDSIPYKCKIFPFSTASTLDLGPTQPPMPWVAGPLSPWVKWQGCEAGHSPPSCAEAKNGAAIPSLSHDLLALNSLNTGQTLPFVAYFPRLTRSPSCLRRPPPPNRC
jgi:hypothetical protein